ncbi:MAG: hypothetical protein II300_07335 [Bacteroidales bacterium]|nr:hypothetical protein [Bacteroidales bacterium]
MKRLIPIFVMLSGIFFFSSCVDEEDFDFDRLSQTTLNPSFGLKLFETEISLGSFLNFDTLIAGVENLELVTRNDEYGEYLEFMYSIRDTFDVEDFVEVIDSVQDVEITLPEIHIPDISELIPPGSTIPDQNLAIPALDLPMEDISIEVPEFEGEVSLDSIRLLSGGIGVSSNTLLPFDVFIDLSSSSLRNNATGELYSQRLQLTSSNGVLPAQNIDLSGYSIFLKDSLEAGNKHFIDLRYRVIIEYSSNTAFTGGTFALGVNLDVSPLRIDIAYGKVGNAVVPVRDSVDLSFLEDSKLRQYLNANSIDLERLKFEIFTETNVGIGAYINPKVYSLTSDGIRTEFFSNTDTLHIRRASRPGLVGTSTDYLETDAAAIEVLPSSLIYNLDMYFMDELYEDDYPAFVQPYEAYVILDTRTTLPINAKLTNLYYEEEVADLGFVEQVDYVKSATLNLLVENEFPASIELNVLLVDSLGVVFDTLLTNPLKVNGAPVDANGNVLTPLADNAVAEITIEKYNKLREASKVRFAVTLNTSAESNGNRPYVRFKRDARIKVKASVKAVADITF